MKRSMGMGTAPRVVVVSSSPGRAEKLPAPPGLARLLRGKSGSRSRGRSSVARSSPMFGARSRAGPSSSEDGEPSSPKVTCIGQVRIRGKNGKPKPAPGSKKPKLEYPHRTTWPTVRCCCCCLERPLLFKKFLKPPAGGPHRWWSLGRRRESIGREESEPSYPPPVAAATATATARVSVSDLGDKEDDVADGEEETRVFMSSTPTPTPPPPKNALLLMRCRSAPHRSAFTRFAVSPPAAGEKEREEPADDRNSCNVIGGTVVLKRSKSVPARMLLTPEITKTATHHLASPPPTKDYTMRPWLSSIIF